MAVEAGFIGCRVTHSVAQAVGSGGFGAILSFDTERYDTAALHDAAVNNSRLTVPIDGRYSFGGCIEWSAATTGYRAITILLNGGTVIGSQRKDRKSTRLNS